MKKYITILFLLTFLFSCSKEELVENKQEQTKTPFYVETKKIDDFSTETLFTKQAKLVSSSQINLTSQATWKIEKINFDIWDSVKKWQVLAVMSDNISNYYTNLERAKNNLERTKINYDSTTLTLDKAINDATLNYEKLQKSHDLLIKDSKEKLKKLEVDLSNSDLSETDSKAKLDYDKAVLDYENSLVSDQNQIDSFISSTKTSYKNLYISYYDIINYLDEIFWVSDKNRYKNDSFEIYLWAKNSSLKTEAENKLINLISTYDSFKNTDLELINESNLITYQEEIENKYLELKDLLDVSKETLKNSVESSSFTSTTINTYNTKIWSYLSSISWNYTSFVSSKSSVKSFLNTYKQNQKSREDQLTILKRQLNINSDSLQSSINTTKIAIQNSIINSENAVKSAKNNLDNTIKNKEITLRSLKNSIKEAEISVSESRKNAWKLTITSPISWIISKKFVDVWQEVGVWTNIFSISWDDLTKASVFLTKDELKIVTLWDNVKLEYMWNKLSWTVESISYVASSNFTYETIIKVLDRVDIIWDFLTVKFVSKLDSILIPVSTIKILWDNKANINTIDQENNINTREINIWQITWNFVEIISEIPENEEIILTDITNYNKKDFEIIKR